MNNWVCLFGEISCIWKLLKMVMIVLAVLRRNLTPLTILERMLWKKPPETNHDIVMLELMLREIAPSMLVNIKEGDDNDNDGLFDFGSGSYGCMNEGGGGDDAGDDDMMMRMMI